MAVYKVPQDVEADDKLLGPFSFRQFIYLLIAGGAVFLAWGLSRLFVPLAIIPLPVILFFGVLALPLRKDQPMEIYMAAIVSFYLKPRRRLWVPDGVESLVEITAPKVVELQRTKDLSQHEAEQRLSYLADIVDTGGWAVRGVAMPEANSPMRSDAFFEAQQTVDMLDEQGGVAQSFDTMINEADTKRRQDIVARMSQPQPATTAFAPVAPAAPLYVDPYTVLQTAPSTATPTATTAPYPSAQPQLQPVSIPQPVVDPYATLQPFTPQAAPEPTNIHVDYNPYPTSMHQGMVRPIDEQPVATTAQPLANSAPTLPPPVLQPIQNQASEESLSPDIINLAHNADLSIETIAHEAERIRQKEEQSDEGEVIISLR
jgi:hypothetical protein